MKGDELIASLGCIVCRRHGIFTKPEIHHVRKLATSKKRKLAPVIPLCYMHHTAGIYGVSLHAGERKFEENYGSVMEMIEETNQLLREKKNGIKNSNSR